MTDNSSPKPETPTEPNPPPDPGDVDFKNIVSKRVNEGGAGGPEILEPERLNASFQVDLQPEELDSIPRPAAESSDRVENFLNEIAEDMLQVLKDLKELQRRQAEIEARLEQLSQGHLATARELDNLRRDLLGERKALAAINVFKTIVPRLDSLRIMQRKLPKKDSSTRQQLQGIMDALTLILQGLGYMEFKVQLKEPFDPERMECCGYADGPLGMVLGLERPGYLAQEQVVRPAGVLIANPKKPVQKKSKRGNL